MANSNGSFGLRPLSKLGSATNSTGLSSYSMYEIANGNTDKIYHGQPVIPLSTGFIGVTANAAGGTVSLLGVFMGCKYVASGTGKPTWSNYWPGSGADSNHPIEAFVEDDPNAANEDFAAAGIGAVVRLNNSFNAPTGSIAAGTVAVTGV